MTASGMGAGPEPFAWSDQAVARLRVLWDEGKSASAIAADLAKDGGDGPSRCSVLGKMHRLGLNRAGRSRSQAKVAVAAPAIEPVRSPPPAAEPSASVEPAERAHPIGLPLLELRSGPGQCRYPTGRDAKGTHLFCAEATPAGESWCVDHRAVVFDQRANEARRQGKTLRLLERRTW